MVSYQAGIKPVPLPLEAWSLNHQTAREFSNHYLLEKKKKVTQINSKWESIHLEFSSEKRQKINDVR